MTKTRILVVDDDPWTQRVVIAALREQNHQIVTASDGAIAVAKATADPPARSTTSASPRCWSCWRWSARPAR